MINRRAALGAIAAVSAIGTSGIARAKEKKHHSGNALLGAKLKQNGKHKIDKAGRIDVSADVSNGKIIGLTASDPTKGNLAVRKVKSKKKFAGSSGLIFAGMQVAQYSDYYYGYWFDDGEDDWYYWFTVDVIIVDNTWVEYY